MGAVRRFIMYSIVRRSILETAAKVQGEYAYLQADLWFAKRGIPMSIYGKQI